MDKNSLTQLTSSLYRLTLLFPKKEPLRYKIRELAVEILENSVKLKSSNPSAKVIPEILKDIKTLDSFFEVAKNQNWVSPQDILNLKKEYSILKEELEKALKAQKFLQEKSDKIEKKEAEFPERTIGTRGRLVSKNPARQQKILEILKQGRKVQVRDLKTIFPAISKRTLRRDFEKLVSQGFVERIGEKQDTFYVSKS